MLVIQAPLRPTTIDMTNNIIVSHSHQMFNVVHNDQLQIQRVSLHIYD